jgi:hypothetical protein
MDNIAIIHYDYTSTHQLIFQGSTVGVALRCVCSCCVVVYDGRLGGD